MLGSSKPTTVIFVVDHQAKKINVAIQMKIDLFLRQNSFIA